MTVRAHTRAQTLPPIEWFGFGFAWEVFDQARPLEAYAFDRAPGDCDELRAVATAHSPLGLVWAMFRAAHRAKARERGAIA